MSIIWFHVLTFHGRQEESFIVIIPWLCDNHAVNAKSPQNQSVENTGVANEINDFFEKIKKQ